MDRSPAAASTSPIAAGWAGLLGWLLVLGDRRAPTGVHLRLDDDWQAGAIWRAKRVDDPHRYSLKAIPPTLPLRLGYAEATDGTVASETVPAEEQPIAATQTGFKVPLTMRDRALDRLRTSADAAHPLAAGTVDVVIRHHELHDRHRGKREGSTLYGLAYPWDLQPGVILHCNVEAGGSVVRIRHPAGHAADCRVQRSKLRLRHQPRRVRARDGVEGAAGKGKAGCSNADRLINRSFRLRGRPRDGARALTLTDLATIILGAGWRAAETRPIAEALAGMGLDRDAAEYLWRTRVSGHTRSSDRTLLAAYGEGKSRGRLKRAVRRHWVPMNLRRYTKRSPYAAKRRSYSEAHQRYGMYGVLPVELPEDRTWVEPYDWGRRGSDDHQPPGAGT